MKLYVEKLNEVYSVEDSTLEEDLDSVIMDHVNSGLDPKEIKSFLLKYAKEFNPKDYR